MSEDGEVQQIWLWYATIYDFGDTINDNVVIGTINMFVKNMLKQVPKMQYKRRDMKLGSCFEANQLSLRKKHTLG